MLLDQTLVFSDKQTLSTSAEASTHVIDQGAEGDTFGRLWLVVKSDADAAGNVTVALETSDEEAFTDKTTLFSRQLAKAELVKDAAPVKIAVPAGAKRYLRAYYTPAGAATVTAFLTDNPEIGR